MRAYAPRFDGDVELWGATGLLHDLDYERYPDLEAGHPRYALRELEARGYPPELIRAVASHADFMGVPRETPMEKTLYAVDELSGFVLAWPTSGPEGLERHDPEVGQEEAQAAELCRRGQPRRLYARAPRISGWTSTSIWRRDRRSGRARG